MRCMPTMHVQNVFLSYGYIVITPFPIAQGVFSRARNFGGLEQPRHLGYLHRRHHSASKISQIYGRDLRVGRGKLTRRERLPSRTKSERRSVEMRL